VKASGIRPSGSPLPMASPETGYYGIPLLKEPAWTWEVPLYFFVGGAAGAAAVVGAIADYTGADRKLVRDARWIAAAGAVISPALLIDDLGRPERFLNMLRVFKPTSPMSVGSWVLAGFGAATGSAAVGEFTGFLRPLGRLAEVVAAALGPVLATYTGVLVADTAVPVWHESRRHLPLVFAGGAMASAGGLAAMTTPARRAGPARRLALFGAALELVSAADMERHLGELAAPYRDGDAARAARLGRGLTGAGAG